MVLFLVYTCVYEAYEKLNPTKKRLFFYSVCVCYVIYYIRSAKWFLFWAMIVSYSLRKKRSQNNINGSNEKW